MKKEYTGSVYLAVVGPDHTYEECRDSISMIRTQPGDSGPHFVRATKGYEARQMHINNFIASQCDFIFMMDHDQIFPPGILERLRSHKAPYVSGLYMRRRVAPVFSVWYKPQRNPDDWPMRPWLSDPERGKLHEIGASGWGCVLIHRDVIMAVRALLKGEGEVLEDDMDVYPYDPIQIASAIRNLRNAIDANQSQALTMPVVRYNVETLEREFRILRGNRPDIVGSDIRFPFYARMAGYKLMGDPDARCGHMIDLNLTPDHMSADSGEASKNQRIADRQVNQLRREYQSWRKEQGL